MFNKLYLGEIKKILRPKTIIAFVVLFLVFFALHAIAYEDSREFMETMEANDSEAPPQEEEQDAVELYNIYHGKVVYTEENIDQYINLAQAELEIWEEQTEDKYFYRMSSDPTYRPKTLLAAFEYIKKNEMYNQEINIYSGRLYDDITTQDYMQEFFEIFLMVVIVCGVGIGAVSYADELKKGSLKMVLMRPITRNKLTTAKILALFTVLILIMGMAYLIVFLYGLRYPLGKNESVLIVFNATNVFMGTSGLMMFLNVLFSIIRLLATALFAFALGTVTKNKIIGIMVGVVVSIGALQLLLGQLGIGLFLFTTNIDFSVFFGHSYSVSPGGNFFITLGVFVAYMSLFLASSYIVFNKRDIA